MERGLPFPSQSAHTTLFGFVPFELLCAAYHDNLKKKENVI